jgi:hypothetical protein
MSLREAAQQALEALEENGRLSAMEILRTALAEPEQEPVAWLQRRFVDSFPAVGYETCDAKDYGAIPVYTHPPQRKPLSDEKVWDIYYEMIQDDRLSFARAIERAHGIGGEA